MKKLLIMFLALCAVLSLTSCGGRNGSDNEGKTPVNIKAWTMHGFEKTVVNAKYKGKLSTEYTVYLAKGETEGCQVAVCADADVKNVTLVLASGNTEDISPSVYSMARTHKIGRRQYTDALVPYRGEKLTLEKNIALPFMLEFKTAKDTPAGEYVYVYELRNKSGKALSVFNITVRVWDFVLPEDKTFATAAGLTHEGVFYNGGAYESWYNVLLDHNICAYTLPYEILDDKADAYMSDPRVTSFMITVPKNQNGGIDEAKLLKIYNKLLANEEWLEKAFFYPLDEPRTPEHLSQLKGWESRLTGLCPRIEICAPYYTNIKVGEGRDQTDEMEQYTDLWCPKLCLWDDVKSYGEFLDYTPEKSFAERMAEQQAKGDRMWTYVCNDPDDPYAQMFIDTEGVNQRLMFWQIYQRNIEGFLYWSTNSYGRKESGMRIDPWEDTNTRIENGEGMTIYGCGFLFYPGKKVGEPSCVPSIRAKIVRDGVDDIEMFYLAEKYLDKDWIVNKTKEGTPTLTEYVNGDKYAALRIEIGNALEAALKNK